MASNSRLLVDAFGRLRGIVHRVADELPRDMLAARLDEDANSIAWLVWHLTRVQDDHVAGVAKTEQIWTSGGWRKRFGLPFPAGATGYGHSSADVAALGEISSRLLTGYYDAVHEHTLGYLETLLDADLDRVVDTAWDPPVTLGVRLVSVISDELQHAGQAAFVKGVLQRR